jgi:glycosyltransferase involved in cell wall biosynthesis
LPDPARIRLLVVTNMYPSERRPVFGSFVRDQVESLRPLGVEPHVEFIDGRTSTAAYLLGLPRVRRAARGPYDLIHAHYGLSGALAVLQRRLPVVITYHGDDLLGTPAAGGGQTAKSRVARALGRWAAPRAGAVVVVSRQLFEALPEGDVRARAHVIPLGIDIERFRPMPRADACRALGLDPARRRILFAADPANVGKRFALARAAAEIVRGRDPGADLHVVHGRPPDTMPLEMNASDVLLLTSVSEGSPMVVKEALACNLPVVSVDVGDVAERVRGVSGCRIVPPDAAAIAEALREALAAGSRSDGRRAVEELSHRRVAERLLAVYRGVMEGAG